MTQINLTITPNKLKVELANDEVRRKCCQECYLTISQSIQALIPSTLVRFYGEHDDYIQITKVGNEHTVEIALKKNQTQIIHKLLRQLLISKIRLGKKILGLPYYNQEKVLGKTIFTVYLFQNKNKIIELVDYWVHIYVESKTNHTLYTWFEDLKQSRGNTKINQDTHHIL